MTNQNRDVQIGVKYKIDEGSVRKAEHSATPLISRLQQVEKANKALQASAGKSAQGIEQIGKSARKTQKDVDDLRKSLTGAAEASAKVKGGGGFGTVGDVSTAFGAVGSVLGGSTGLGSASQIAGDITGAVESIGKLKESFNELGVQGVGKLLATIGPAAIAVGALTAATAVYLESVKGADQAILNLISSQEAYYNALRKLSSEGVQSQIRDLQAQLTDAQSKRQEILAAEANRFEGDQRQFLGDVGARIRTGVRSIFDGAEEEITTTVNDLGKTITKTQADIDRLTNALNAGQFATNDFIQGVRDRIDSEERYSQILRDGTKASIERRIEELKLMQSSIQKAVATTQEELAKALANAPLEAMAGNGAQAAIKIQELSNFLEELEGKLEDTTNDLNLFKEALPAVTFKEFTNDLKNKFNNAIKDAGEFIDKVADEAERLSREQAKEGIKSFFDKLGSGIEDFTKKAEQATGATQKYNEEVGKIQQADRDRRLEIERNYSDKLVEIAAEAASAAENALTELIQKRAELARNFTEEETSAAREFQLSQMDARIQFQREEAQAYREHQRNLQRILEDSQDRQYELAFNRDFAGLFLEQRSLNRNLNRANEDFTEDRQQSQAELQQTLADAARQYEQERQQRLANYQRSLAEAQAAYNAEIVQADNARRLALQKADEARRIELANQQNSYIRQLQARQDALNKELEIIRRGGQARISLEGAIQAGLVAQASRAVSTISSILGLFGVKKGTGKADGGGVSAFTAYPVNELKKSSGREFFSSGGVNYPFPQVAGMFIPTQPGYVNANNGPSVINMPITVNESKTPQLTAQAVSAIADRQILATMGIKR